MKILLVEDQKDMREILAKRLKKEYSVDVCEDGKEAVDYLSVYSYDMVVLDIMLPKMNGIEVLKWMRNKKLETPVLLLTARNSIEDRVNGLDSGADDYLVKPFSYEELMARIRVLTRRNSKQSTAILQIEDLCMDTVRKSVTRGEKVIQLTAKEYMLLEYMMHYPHMILTRNQLEQRAWDSNFEGGSNIVDVYIRYLRRKVDEGFDKKLIHTVRGQGYRLGDEK